MSYPITWKPAHSDNFAVGRVGKVPAWLVHHRMVGFLTGTDRHFAKAGVRTSTHFGIGHRTAGGPVEISQYVKVDDRAFGNGNNVNASGDEVRSEWNRLNFPPRPNEHTISIEHEDGATLNRGVVTDDIIEASIWLDQLLLSGDPAALRKAGIRFDSDALVRAIGRITPRDETHIVDHHFIAGPLKPFCWRPWLDDKGFPQARYLAALNQEADVPGLTITDIVAAPGVLTVKNIAGVQAVQVDDPSQRFGAPVNGKYDTVAKGRLVGDPLGKDTGPVGSEGDRHTVRLIGQELAVLLDGQVTFEQLDPVQAELERAADRAHAAVLAR